MYKFRIAAFILLISMIVIPYGVYILNGNSISENPENTDNTSVADMEILLYRTESGQVEKVNCFDYICSVVAGEMPASYETEALKAQAVAAFTYTVNKMEYVTQNPDSDIGHCGAYVCDDYTHCKAYLEKEIAEEKWGSAVFKKYYPRIENAVSEVLGEMLTYNGKTVNAVFHAISNGKTLSAKEVWGTDVEYLQSVKCEWDKGAEGYNSKTELTHSEFSKKIYDELGITLPENADEWESSITLTDSGTVQEFKICETVLSGTYIRKLFSLRSASFDFEITKDGVVFDVRGYGHGVGMSQYGANEMAKQGKNYKEILKYFYTGVEIENFK